MVKDNSLAVFLHPLRKAIENQVRPRDRKRLKLVEVVDSSDRPVMTVAIELNLPGRGQMVCQDWGSDEGH